MKCNSIIRYAVFFPFLPVMGYLPQVSASGFIEDTELTGGLYYWQRHRERKLYDPTSDKNGHYQQNLHHSTFNANLDFSSGYAADHIGMDLAVFGVLEMSDKGPAAPNEIAFSDSRTRWDEKWSGNKNGTSIYKAALKFKNDNYWLRAGYIQPAGQSLLAPHWSFLPGTWRGVEVGSHFDLADTGKLSLSWMWSDKYKAPWYQRMYDFRKADGKTHISYLHSLGAKFAFKNDLILEGAFGQSENYINQYFSKVSYQFPVAGNPLKTSWQFYVAEDREHGGANNVNDVYDGLAWLQAMTFGILWERSVSILKARWSKLKVTRATSCKE